MSYIRKINMCVSCLK